MNFRELSERADEVNKYVAFCGATGKALETLNGFRLFMEGSFTDQGTKDMGFLEREVPRRCHRSI